MSTIMARSRQNYKAPSAKNLSPGADYKKLDTLEIPCRVTGNYRTGRGWKEYRRLVLEKADEFKTRYHACNEIFVELETKNIRFVSWDSSQNIWTKSSKDHAILKITRALQQAYCWKGTTRRPSAICTKTIPRRPRTAAVAAAARISIAATGRAKVFDTIPPRASNSACAVAVMEKGVKSNKKNIPDFLPLAAQLETGWKIESIKVIIKVSSAESPPLDLLQPTLTTTATIMHQGKSIKKFTKRKAVELENPSGLLSMHKGQYDAPRLAAKKSKAAASCIEKSPPSTPEMGTLIMTNGNTTPMPSEHQTLGRERVVSIEKLSPMAFDKALAQVECDTRQPLIDFQEEPLVDMIELDCPPCVDVPNPMEESYSFEPFVPPTTTTELDALNLLRDDDSIDFLRSFDTDDGIPLIPFPKNCVFHDNWSSIWDNEVSP